MKLIKHVLCALALLTALTATAGNVLLKGGTTSTRQDDLLSKNMVIDKSQMKNIHFSSDDITDPEEREAMRLHIRTKSLKERSNVSTQRKGGENLYTVKCVFTGDYKRPNFAIFNKDLFLESNPQKWMESDEVDTFYFQVPAGTYDVRIGFYSRVEGMNGHANIIHEDIIIESDTEVIFSPDELTEKVVFKPFLRNGKEAILPICTLLDEDPWYEFDYTNATIDFLYMYYTFFREGCETLNLGHTISNAIVPGSFEEITFLSNKLSDNYHCIFQYFLEDMNGEIQITTTDMVGVVSGEINNYTSDFVKYPIPTFSKTPIYNEIGIEQNNLALNGSIWRDGIHQIGGGMYLNSLYPSVYCSTQPTCNRIEVKTPVRVTNIQGEKTFIWQEEEDGEIYEFSYTDRAEMVGLPAIYNGFEWEYINQNHSNCGNFSYQVPEDGPIFEYPGVPAYCYFSNQITQPIGNSSPVLSLMTQVNKYSDITIFSINPNAYIGRYGEIRNCDQWNLNTLITINGEQAFDSSSGLDLYDWCVENSTNGHEKGILEATFTNRNVLVDETITGFNITTIKVDERSEDLCSPTTQMLMFKNANGEITDRFENGTDGIIEFSAGDFIWNWIDGNNWYYTCDEADVKLEYAAYGEDNFMPLEVEEIPENYYMPGFGYFYRGSLADVTMPTSNGWYDLRFTLTDKAGNEMVQRISPAFKIEGNTSVGAVTIDGIKVWSANGNIFANGAEIASMSLYSADGKLINTSNGTTLPTNGYHGIAIVKVTNSHGETTTHKTTLR